MSQAAPAWYSVRKLTPIASAARGVKSAAEIFVYGDIGESWWEETVSAAQFVKDIEALDVDAITVRINSMGGSVPDGIAIRAAMRRHRATVTTVVDGMALSIASLIFMGGDIREMGESSVLMVHAPWTYAAGNATQLRDMADQLDTWARAMSDSYATDDGMTAADALALMSDGRDHYYTAAEAKAAGFCTEVVAAMPIAASARFDLSRFKNLPPAAQAFSATPVTKPAPVAATPAAPAASITEPSMPTPVNTPDAAAIKEAQAQALTADKTRREGIRAHFKAYGAREGVSALLQSCEDDSAITPEAAATKLLAHLGSQAAPIQGSVQTVTDEGDKRRDAITASIMVRAGTATEDQKKQIHANPFRGAKLLDIARASLQAAGIRTDGKDQMQIVGMAFTQGTSDFPVLLENAMHKTLQAAYALAPDTWSRFCARGTVSDFRAHNRYRIGSFGNLDAVNELAEFKNKAIPDGEKASITATTKGNIINLSRQAIINDDLGAFMGLAAMLGRAARRTIEADVYAALASNSGLGPTLGDGLTLFHASHNNITTAAAMSMVAVDLDRVAMASQVDVSGNDYLDLRPSVLLIPLSLGATARAINEAQYDPDTANKLNKPNTSRGLFNDIVDTPRLTGTRRYMFADPNVAPVLEVAFLDGNDTPYLELKNGFEVDGAAYKVRMDYGVAGVDYRGAVTNAGA